MHTDRRGRMHQHSVPEVMVAIDTTVFGEDDRRIMYDLFVDCKTYEQTAGEEHISLRGLYKRVGKVAPAVENALQRMQ